MTTIPTLLKEKTPFAVIQYFESLKSLKSQTNKVYELVYVTDKKKLGYKQLSEREIHFVKRHPALKVVVDTKDGRVYEFNDFKTYKEANVEFEIPTLTFGKKEIEEYINLLKNDIKEFFTANVFQYKKPKERSDEFKKCLRLFELTYEKQSKYEKK